MKIEAVARSEAERADLYAALLPEGELPPLPGDAGKKARAIAARKEWSAKPRETLLVFGGEKADQRLLLVGLGKAKELDAEGLRRAAAIAFKEARRLKAKRISVLAGFGSFNAAVAGSAIAEGIVLASYDTPTRRAQKPDDKPFDPRVRIAAVHGSPAFEGGIERGVAVAEATNRARRLGDLPGNELPPLKLAAAAQAMARANGIRARVYSKQELERLKMGGILGVARGSAEPPVLIELEYRPKRFQRTVALVGKGLTFDTGGISIKPAANMEEMKYDMCGGAAVIGAMEAAARLELPVRVVGIVPSSENMPGSAAQKPGDVLITAAGISVEVINTDAEGRLILADGLHHAVKFEPDYVIDLATLTGACVIALGHDAAGLWSNDERLARLLHQAGEEAGDRAWHMPLYAEYADDLKSAVAELKNVGRREGSAGSAAHFLSRFAADRKWAHLDIAGTAWGGRARDWYASGATGAGVRLLVRFLESLR